MSWHLYIVMELEESPRNKSVVLMRLHYSNCRVNDIREGVMPSLGYSISG